MTQRANLNNIKPMFRQIAWMVVISCLRRAILTFKSAWRTKPSISDSMTNGHSSLLFFRMFAPIYFGLSTIVCFASFGLSEFFVIFKTCFAVRLPSFFALLVCFLHDIHTKLTRTMHAVFVTATLIKFRNWLNFPTFRALLHISYYTLINYFVKGKI